MSSNASSFVNIHQTPREVKQPKLFKGQVVAFRISPEATAVEYDNLFVMQAIQGTYGTYLGVVKSSMIVDTPSVVDGYASREAEDEVELLKIAYIGAIPPTDDMLDNKQLVPFLPRGSLSFLSIPILRPHSTKNHADLLAHHRSPLGLQAVGGGGLPVELGFVHTSFAVNAHLATLHTGATSLTLAQGEPSRLAAASAADTTEIGKARTRLLDSLKLQTITEFVSANNGTEPYKAGSNIPESRPPAFTNVAIDVWTDLSDIGPIGEPAAFRSELARVASAIEQCYEAEPDPVEKWAQDVQNDSLPQKRTFGPSILLAVGAGVFGPIFGRVVQLLRR